MSHMWFGDEEVRESNFRIKNQVILKKVKKKARKKLLFHVPCSSLSSDEILPEGDRLDHTITETPLAMYRFSRKFQENFCHVQVLKNLQQNFFLKNFQQNFCLIQILPCTGSQEFSATLLSHADLKWPGVHSLKMLMHMP